MANGIGADSPPSGGSLPYRGKPPLWQSKVPQASAAKIATIVIGTMVAVFVLFVLGFEKDVLGVAMGQVEVVVIRIQDDKPQAKLPPSFRYIVALPDGKTAAFISDQIQAPGSRLVVTVIRGRVSGRIWLGGPYRLAAPPKARE